MYETTAQDNLETFNTAWIAGWPGVIARAWLDEAFKAQLLRDALGTVHRELGFPLIDDLHVAVVEGINRATFHFALVDAVPLPTTQWRVQWPGLIQRLRGDSAFMTEFVADPEGFCARQGLPVLEHVLLSVDERAERHEITMPLPLPGQSIADYIRNTPVGMKLNPQLDCYASSSCC